MHPPRLSLPLHPYFKRAGKAGNPLPLFMAFIWVNCLNKGKFWDSTPSLLPSEPLSGPVFLECSSLCHTMPGMRSNLHDGEGGKFGWLILIYNKLLSMSPSKIQGNSLQSSWCLNHDLLVKIGNDTTNVLGHTETLWVWGVKRHHGHDNCDHVDIKAITYHCLNMYKYQTFLKSLIID